MYNLAVNFQVVSEYFYQS